MRHDRYKAELVRMAERYRAMDLSESMNILGLQHVEIELRILERRDAGEPWDDLRTQLDRLQPLLDRAREASPAALEREAEQTQYEADSLAMLAKLVTNYADLALAAARKIAPKQRGRPRADTSTAALLARAAGQTWRRVAQIYHAKRNVTGREIDSARAAVQRLRRTQNVIPFRRRINT
jgi:hypothetical protein